MKKKLLAIVLALVLVVGVLPLTAFASDPECICERVVGVKNDVLLLKTADDTTGLFYFDTYGDGWSIESLAEEDSDYPYLAVSEGELYYSDSPYYWQYDNGAFFVTTVTTEPSRISGFWSWLLSFGRKKITGEGTVTVTHYFYLASLVSGSDLATYYTPVVLTEHYEGTHDFGAWINCLDGHHKHFCKNCGAAEVYECVYDPETHLCICGAIDPNMKHPFDIDVDETTNVRGFWKFNFKSFATKVIITDSENNYKIEISTNGGDTWTEGDTVTSYITIKYFLIKVTNTETGAVYFFKYDNGKIISIYDPNLH